MMHLRIFTIIYEVYNSRIALCASQLRTMSKEQIAVGGDFVPAEV